MDGFVASLQKFDSFLKVEFSHVNQSFLGYDILKNWIGDGFVTTSLTFEFVEVVVMKSLGSTKLDMKVLGNLSQSEILR